jgi:hypothetical protein
MDVDARASNIPDDVPVADAVEQQQTTADLVPDAGLGARTPPLESDPSDWQEQHQTLDDPDPDDERR